MDGKMTKVSFVQISIWCWGKSKIIGAGSLDSNEMQQKLPARIDGDA